MSLFKRQDNEPVVRVNDVIRLDLGGQVYRIQLNTVTLDDRDGVSAHFVDFEKAESRRRRVA